MTKKFTRTQNSKHVSKGKEKRKNEKKHLPNLSGLEKIFNKNQSKKH
jgi:hypothetical protein